MKRQWNSRDDEGETSLNFKLKITRAVLFPLCVLMLFGFALFSSYQKVDALTAGSVSVGEIYNSDHKCFDGDTLQDLFVSLTGNQNATYTEVNNLISGSTTALTAANIKTKAGGKNITVTFGGMQWTVVFLTRTRTQATSSYGQVSTANGDLIATLWLADTDGTTSSFTDGWSGSVANYTWATPANMYGTSYLRSVTLNAGGMYSKYNGTVATVSSQSNLTTPTATKDANNRYAAFTMTQAELASAGSSLVSLTDYIVSPKNVAYQETLCSKNISTESTNYANVGYGTPGVSASNGAESTYRSKAHYADWAADYLWAPAAEEIMSGKGYWKTDANQRKSAQNFWVRTSRSDSSGSTSATKLIGNCSYRFAGTTDGGWGDSLASEQQGVRPALHLNLTKAAAAAIKIPQAPASGVNLTYSGVEQTLNFSTYTDFDANKMYVSGIERVADGATSTVSPSVDTSAGATAATKVKFTDAGTYAVTLKAKTATVNGVANSQLYWYANENSTDPTETTLQFTVKRKQLSVPSFGVGNANTQPYDSSTLTFTASGFPNALVPSTPTTAYPVNPLSVTFTKDSATVTLTSTPQSDGTLKVEARNAGSYEASFTVADTTNYEWTDGTQGAKSAAFTVKKKPLTVTPSDGGAWGWSADSVTKSATLTASGICDGDAVDIRMEITDTSGTTTHTGTYSGGNYVFTINAALFGGNYTPGRYGVKLVYGGGADDGNYDLETSMNALGNLELIISASIAGLENYSWEIRESGGTWEAIAANGSKPYTGSPYEVRVVQTGFAGANIKIDDSADRQAQGFVNGYKNESAINAGTYTTRVAICVTDPTQYAFADGSTTTEVTFTWKIDKATIGGTFKWQYTDASGNVQTYDPATAAGPLELPWKGTNYTLTLTDLPSGVTVNPGSSYAGNVGKTVDTYSATCTSLRYDTTNYVITTPTLAWSIVPLKIELNSASWITDPHASGATSFYLPHIDSPYDGTGILYEYYDADTTPYTKLNGIGEIVVSSGTMHNYYVKAILSSATSTDGLKPWDQVLQLSDTTNPPYGDDTMAFQTGDNRTPVSVSLSGNPARYDGKPHGLLGTDILVRVGSNDFDPSQFDIRYFDYDAGQPNGYDPTSPRADGAPINAGKYVIVVGLSASAEADYFLSATTFEFEIEKYKFDLSGAKWGYVDGAGVEHVYNPSSPLQYELDGNGDPVNHELKLVGLPCGDANGDAEAQLLAEMFAASGLANLFTYTGNTANSVTSTSPNRAEYTFAPDAAFEENFEVVNLPSGDPFEWRIDVKKIAKPKDDESKTFDGEAIDLLGLAGLDAGDLDKYFEIRAVVLITPGGELRTLNPSDLGTFKDAGEYRLTAQLKDTANMRWDDNGILKTAAQQFTIRVGVLEITVSDWEGDGKEPYTPIFNNGMGNVPNVWRSIFEDSSGNLITDDSWKEMYGETFKQRLAATEGNEENVKFVYASDVDEEKTFTLTDPSEISVPVTRPTFGETDADGVKRGTYTGGSQSFLPENIRDLIDKNRVKLYAVDEDGKEREIDESFFTQTDAGKYTVRARLQSPYVWLDTNNREPIDFKFEIEPAKIAPEWKVDSDGKPIASMPEEFGKFKDAFDYHYYDENGTEVAEEDLVPNQTYTVGATLKEEYAKNFVLVDGAGETLEDGISMSEDPYVHPQSGFLSFLTQPFLFGLPMWLWLIIFLILLILLLILLIVLIKRRKKRKENRELAQEKKEEEERNRQEKQEEKERAEQEKREREEERKRQQEEREEERRRQQEEREEERRRKEEEREEERRRRQEEREEREEERRRQREEREEEMRRREEERRNASMGVGMGMMGAGMGMGMGMQQQPMQQPQMPQQPYYPPQQQPNGMQQPYQEQPQQTYQEQPQYQEQAQQPYEVVQDPNWQEETYVYEPEEAEAEIVYADDPGQSYGQPVRAPVYVSRAGNEIMSTRLSEYEQRLRDMERELQQKRIETICQEENARAQKEFEAEERKRRQEEELRRLKELQEDERIRRRELEQMPYFAAYVPPQRPFTPPVDEGSAQLRSLEEELRRKQAENRMILERMQAEIAAARAPRDAGDDPKHE